MNRLFEFSYSLLLAFIIFWPLEKAFMPKKQKTFRSEWLTDFLFFAGQFFLWGSFSFFILTNLRQAINHLELNSFQQIIAQQPYWLQAFEIIFLCDILIYWGHRFSHKWDFLWRFHKVHHSPKKLDWLAAYREHPFDNVYTVVIENLPALLLGFPLETIGGFILFRGLWGLFIHSNVNITLGPLAYFIGSPRLHHWHHEKSSSGKCNFANLSPLMDLLFGTYYDPGHEPKEFGIPTSINRNYFRQIIDPILPDSLLKKISKQFH